MNCVLLKIRDNSASDHILIMSKYIIPISLLAFSIGTSESARILGVFPVKSKSHHSIHESVLKILINRGHQITAVTALTMKLNIASASVANYTEFLFEDPSGDTFEDSYSIDKAKEFQSLGLLIKFFYESMEKDRLICQYVFSTPVIRSAIESNVNMFDLLLVETYCSPCFSLLAVKLGVPMIVTAPFPQYAGLDMKIGNPTSPSVLPHIFTGHTPTMNFWQRLSNTIMYTSLETFIYLTANSYTNHFVNNYLLMDCPPDSVLDTSYSIVFYNTHEVLLPRPMAPSSIYIAGIHVQEANPLSKEMQKIVDEAEHGVIVFSLGTTLQANSMHPEKLDILMRVFSKMPQTILWRSNDEPNGTDIPANVKLMYWLPQRDLLEHKNVRAFISHCGQLSTIEAIHTGTPVVAMPISFDQLQNGAILKEKGVAIYIDYDTVNENEFTNAMNNIINDTRYKENMEKLSQMFKDRPLSPADTVSYWIDYVLRYNGTGHIRSSSVGMPLYKYLLLDIVILTLAIVVLLVYTCVFVKKTFLKCYETKNKFKTQ